MHVSWIGTHQLKLKSFISNPDPTRGINGLYDFEDSRIITLNIQDPCVNTVVNDDQQLQVLESWSIAEGFEEI